MQQVELCMTSVLSLPWLGGPRSFLGERHAWTHPRNPQHPFLNFHERYWDSETGNQCSVNGIKKLNWEICWHIRV